MEWRSWIDPVATLCATFLGPWFAFRLARRHQDRKDARERRAERCKLTLSVLREPVERTLSHLRHHRKMTPETRELSLEALYDEVFVPVYFHNHMVKMFSLTAGEIAASAEKNTWAAVRAIDFTPERLARAKDQVSRLDVLGVHDHFEEFCTELVSRYGWALGEPLFANRTTTEAAPASLRARIAADNAMDVELFEYARDLYERRRRGHD